MNEKREAISHIEKNHDIAVTIVPNPEIQSPRYKIRRLGEEESGGGARKPSYKLIEALEPEVAGKKAISEKHGEQPAVKNVFDAGTPDSLDAASKKPSSPNLIKRLWSSMFGGSETEEKIEKPISGTSKPSVHEHKKADTRTSGRREPRRQQHHTSKNTDQQKTTEHSGSEKGSAGQPQQQQAQQQGQQQQQGQHHRGNRTRRGTRGGRRRTGGHRNPSARKPAAQPTETVTPPEFPPFPNDLEEYVKETSVPRGSRSVYNYEKDKSSDVSSTETKPAEASSAEKPIEIKSTGEKQNQQPKSAETKTSVEAKPVAAHPEKSKAETQAAKTSEQKQPEQKPVENKQHENKAPEIKKEIKAEAPKQSAAPFAQPFIPIPNIGTPKVSQEPVVVRADDQNKAKPTTTEKKKEPSEIQNKQPQTESEDKK